MVKEATATAAAAAAETERLPKAIVRRMVKEKLSQLSADADGAVGDFNLHNQALLAFTESARIFIHYLSATANDICKESRRQTINAEVVLKAVEEIEFPEFIEPLRVSLAYGWWQLHDLSLTLVDVSLIVHEFRKRTAQKRAGSAKTKEPNKKKKTDKEVVVENGDDQVENDDDEGDNDASNE
ncbi:DNA polymerase II subunit B4-like protein [Drosera capensis]